MGRIRGHLGVVAGLLALTASGCGGHDVDLTNPGSGPCRRVSVAAFGGGPMSAKPQEVCDLPTGANGAFVRFDAGPWIPISVARTLGPSEAVAVEFAFTDERFIPIEFGKSGDLKSPASGGITPQMEDTTVVDPEGPIKCALARTARALASKLYLTAEANYISAYGNWSMYPTDESKAALESAQTNLLAATIALAAAETALIVACNTPL